MPSVLSRLVPATTRARILAVAALAAVIALVSVLLVVTSGPPSKQVTAYFSETIGVYPGSNVEILGVPVGTIDSVTPEGKQVKVTMTIKGGIQVPASADAVVVAPSVVADRYIQLTPAYNGGALLASHAVIPAARTATPVEVDQLYSSLNKLATDLGPNGANANGALSNVLNTGAKNLAGNGKNFNDFITELGAATRTLSGSRGNLFATINNLQKFTTTLAGDNGQVQQAEQQLAQVNGFLADDRTDLAGALHELSVSLAQVQSFIGDNRALIKSNVTKLASITKSLVTERNSLAEALNELPLAVDNVVGAYDPASHTLNGRGNLRELTPGVTAASSGTSSSGSANVFCTATSGSSSSSLGQLCQQEKTAGAGQLVPVSGQAARSLPPLPLPAVGSEYGPGSAVPAKKG